jgi:hypothetical protein
MGIADYFNQGVARGWSMSREAEAAKAARAKAEQEAKLKLDLQSAFESNPDLGPEDAGRAEAFNNYNAKIANEDADTFGVKYNPAGYAYGNTPKSQTDVTVARNMSVAKALAAAGDVRGAMDAQRAAELARMQDRDSVRQDRRDTLAERQAGLGIQKDQLSVQKMMGEQDQAEKTKAFDAEVGEMYSAGAAPDSKAILGLAAKHGVPTDYAANLYLKQVGVSKQDALNLLDQKLTTLKDAATKGLPALLELADPDPTDSKKPEVMKNKDGSLTLMYAGKPMQGFEKLPAENTAAVIYKQIEGIYKGDPFAAAAVLADQEMQKAKLAEVQSKTGENQAQAAAAYASADERKASAAKTRQEMKTPGGGGGAQDKNRLNTKETLAEVKAYLGLADSQTMMFDPKEKEKRQGAYQAASKFVEHHVKTTGQAPPVDQVIEAMKIPVGTRKMIGDKVGVWDGRGWMPAK